MAKNIDNMLFIESSTPQGLKDKLNSIEVLFSIMQGTLNNRVGKHYCWILLDRPVTTKIKNGRAKPREVEVGTNVNTNFIEGK